MCVVYERCSHGMGNNSLRKPYGTRVKNAISYHKLIGMFKQGANSGGVRGRKWWCAMLHAVDDCRDVLVMRLCVLSSMSCIWRVCECDSRDRECGRWLGLWLVWVTRQGVGIVV